MLLLVGCLCWIVVGCVLGILGVVGVNVVYYLLLVFCCFVDVGGC